MNQNTSAFAKLSLLALAALCLGAVAAGAATLTSTGAGGDWSTAATWSPAQVPAAADTVIIAAGSPVTTSANTLSCASLTINTGAILTMWRPFTVSGATIISGTINFGSTGGTSRLITFTGDVTLNSGAVWNETTTGAAATFSFAGNIVNNATTFTAQNTTHTFTGSNRTLSGTTSLAQATFTGAYQNIGTITATTALSGTGGLTQDTNATLNIGGTSTITALTATNNPNTVAYTGAAQTVKATNYYNLLFSGSGAKSMGAGTSVGGNLSIAPTGSATASVGSALSLSVGSLTLGGAAQPDGTYGGAGSPAGTINTTYFAATTGYLTVGTVSRVLITLPGQTFIPGTGNGGAVSGQTAGIPFNITLTAVDASNNIDSTVTGPKTVIYSGPGTPAGGTAPTYTTNVTFTAGQATSIPTTLTKAETLTTFTAIIPGLTGVASSSLTVAPGPAAKLAFTTQPGGGTGGTAWPTQPLVAVQDSVGNTITTDASTVTVAILNNAGPGGVLSGTLTKAAVSGVANFSANALKIDKVGTGYTLIATDGSLASATSSAFNITVGAAAKLAFTTQPSGGTGGTAWTTQPVVTVQDAGGNTVTTDASTVTVAILNNAGPGGVLRGTLTKAAVSGVANFSANALNIDKSGTGYTLTATDGALASATSSPFNIAVGPAATLAFTTQPGGGTAGTAWTTQPVVTVQDAGGNTVTTDASTVTVAIGSNPGGGVLSGTLTKAAISGLADFSANALQINKSGTGYTLIATDGALTSATSSGFNITAGAVAAAQSTVSAAPSSVRADGNATSTITVTLLDANSNPVAGKTVTLASSRGATDTLTPTSGVSSASGVVTFTVKSSTTGSPVFTATDTTDSVTVAQTATVTFTVNPPASASNSTVSAAPAKVWANGTSPSTITVTLRESGNTAVANKTVTLASSRGATDTITPTSGVSSASGVVTFTVRSSTPGSSVFTATDTTDSVTVTQTAIVTFAEVLAGGAHPTNDCASCHITHNALGLNLTSVAGNANLCLSCHTAGSLGSSNAFSATDQAWPWPGLPAGVSPGGSSHRWDSGAAGHVTLLSTNPTSTGTLLAGGAFTGAYANTYFITITNAGGVGTARFNWTATTPGGGSSNVVTGTNVTLNQGINASFLDGTGTSFHVNDQWSIHVRPDLKTPTNATLLVYLDRGLATCSTCHDEHSQANPPFDTNAPASGLGRHYMRIPNDTEQMCVDCHAPRVVTNAAAGSHPVGILITTGLYYKTTASLPLEGGTGKVRCLTCHTVHYSAADDGDLLRLTNSLTLCIDCHTLADTASPGAHFVQTNSAMLWPGSPYGTTFPRRTNTTDRGTCVNCHAPHGWPAVTNTTSHYPKLLVDLEENVCFTCHDADGPAVKQVQNDFTKTRHHPVADSQQQVGRQVECNSCHNAHKARIKSRDYNAIATASRNAVTNSGALAGVPGVAVNYGVLGNFVAPALGNYTTNITATMEFQICFKCHSALAWNFGTAPIGLSPNGTATTPPQTDLAQEFSSNNLSGHPIVTGLDNYPNSTAVGGKRGLLATAMRAPWNVNVGQQTMMCSDCHNTDQASPAAQGPHGSAAQFILRGPNANNWPTGTDFASSWCNNCHIDTVTGMDGHASHHGDAGCYACHIVIPHGGKMSRLIGDRDTMPARYAYNSTLTTMQMQSFTKTTASGYQEGNCRACGEHSGGTENW